MNIQETRMPHHWNYFLALDDDVVRLSRYVEPAEENFGTYSLEMARVLASAASEVDVVAKQICQKLNPDSTADRMNVYRTEIAAVYPNIFDAQVYIPKFGLTLNPWASWKEDASPVWWKANTNVKHQRHTHFSDASLKNTLDAIAGLFVLLLYFYPEEGRNGQLSPNPSLFRAGPPFHTDSLAWQPHVTVYSLDSMDLVNQRLQANL
ncbi:MAG: hypothetical protein JWQ21_1385 [Herminiimonas sp.]|nr:hypothetical protein [Herminiimonas sp.]